MTIDGETPMILKGHYGCGVSAMPVLIYDELVSGPLLEQRRASGLEQSPRDHLSALDVGRRVGRGDAELEPAPSTTD